MACTCDYTGDLQLSKVKRYLRAAFVGFDTHALPEFEWASALGVLVANGVEVMLAVNDQYTPTPAISHGILTYNRRRGSDFADGIVVPPSHNLPRDGGLKYNPPHGGPAGDDVTPLVSNGSQMACTTQRSASQEKRARVRHFCVVT